MSKTTNKYSPEVREQYESRWSAILSICSKIGCAPQTLNAWVKKAEVDRCDRAGVTGEIDPTPNVGPPLARVFRLLVRPRTFYRPRREFSGFDQGDRLVMPPDFVSVIGALLPIALCGRSSL